MNDETEEPGTAIVPVGHPPVAPLFDWSINHWSSLPKEDTVTLLYALQVASPQLSEQINKVIDVQHMVIQRVELTNEETGEVEEADRIVLISPNGDMHQCTSAGIRRSMQTLVGVYGPLPWNPPRPLMMLQIPTKSKRRYFVLVPPLDKNGK